MDPISRRQFLAIAGLGSIGILVTDLYSAQKRNQQLSLIPTFHSVGIYYPSRNRGECRVQYAQAGDSQWKTAMPLWYSQRDNEYRGSLVNLQPGKEYRVRIECQNAQAEQIITTLDEEFPVGKTTEINEGVHYSDLKITESGTPDGYHLIQPAENSRATIDVMNQTNTNIEIDADYVIIRGLELKNAARDGIVIEKNRHHIVIEDCRITKWGRMGGSLSFGNRPGHGDSAIVAEEGTQSIIVQRNLIEHPRGFSNDWTTGHPRGPWALNFKSTRGQHVIRYNEMWSSEDHGYTDIIGGSPDYSMEAGGLHRDTDIYGNIFRNAWDDAVECEGTNINIRIWGNYFEKYFVGVAIAGTSRGPLYIFRNVFGESRKHKDNPMGGKLIKTSGEPGLQDGQKYIFHNTVLQPNGPMDIFSDSDTENVMTRNNIFDVPGILLSEKIPSSANDFDYDYYNGNESGAAEESHGVSLGPRGVLHYTSESEYQLIWYPASTSQEVKYGKHVLRVNDEEISISGPMVYVENPVIDAGTLLPGFNDDYSGSAPDMGAFERGNSPLEFGRRAYSGKIPHFAPWESHK